MPQPQGGRLTRRNGWLESSSEERAGAKKEYEPENATKYEAKQAARKVQKLTKQAAARGYELRAVGN